MSTRIIFASLVVIGLVSAAAAQVADPPIRVVLSGTASPITGFNYTGFYPVAKVNNSGQVAFKASLGVPFPEGNFAGAPGSLATAASTGGSTPIGGTYVNFTAPFLNDGGQVAFVADIAHGSSSDGIFAGAPGSLAPVALHGMATPAGGFFSGPFLLNQFNNAGQAAFYVGLSGTSATQGIFVGTAGTLSTVAVDGAPAPAGGNYVGFSTVSPLALNNAGQVAFACGLTVSGSGIFAGAPGSLTTVALVGLPTPAGGNYSGFQPPNLNNSMQVAFKASLILGSLSIEGIFAGAPGSLTTVALEGTPTPGGGNYFAFPDNTPMINNAGQVAFRAQLSSSIEGIFAGVPGSLVTVALTGDPAPAGAGAVYSNVLSAPELNNAGVVAFQAGLTGPGVTLANDLALYAGLPGGIIKKVVRTGDVIDVDPGPGTDFRTIAPGGISPDFTFADSGHLIYRLEFTDGSSGIFMTIVPEPGTAVLLGLIAVGTVLAGGRTRHSLPLLGRRG